MYQRQHDNHLIPWLKAKFNITVQWDENGCSGWLAYADKVDLSDCCAPVSHHNGSVFETAMEYGMSYCEHKLFDKLCDIEAGDYKCSSH